MDERFDQDWLESDLVGGHAALDFVNTAGGATKARDAERLRGYGDALRWSQAAGVLTPEEAAALSVRAAEAPEDAGAALEKLRTFREALHRCLMAEQAGQSWQDVDRLGVVSTLRSAAGEADLARDGKHFRWRVPEAATGLGLILARVALEAEALLRSGDLSEMRNCDRCSWLFIDRGRGRPRRWCSMATCGSRAKSARYYRRHKGGDAGGGD